MDDLVFQPHVQLLALLRGLDVPDVLWWSWQSPEALEALGRAVSGQAKRVMEKFDD